MQFRLHIGGKLEKRNALGFRTVDVFNCQDFFAPFKEIMTSESINWYLMVYRRCLGYKYLQTLLRENLVAIHQIQTWQYLSNHAPENRY